MRGGDVQVVDLIKRFGPVTAVDGINLHMPGGEFFSMLGPSGSGKTTLLRLTAGFERPDAGTVATQLSNEGNPDTDANVKPHLPSTST